MKYNKDQIIEALKKNSVARNLFGKRIDEFINDAIDSYNEPHRYYHNLNHIKQIFSLIDTRSLSLKYYEILQLVAIIHDVFYYPKTIINGKTNEECSAEWFNEWFKDDVKLSTEKRNLISLIKRMILETQYIKTEESTCEISKIFNELDLDSLINGNLNSLINNEKLISKEYQFNNYLKYKEGRINFLNSIMKHKLVQKNNKNISLLIEHIKNYIPHIGIYAGTFDPFHIGHKNILEKANKLFDKVIVAIGYNPEKPGRILNSDIVSKVIPFYEVDKFSGALSEYIKSVETYSKVTLVRGLRNGYDFNYEINQLRFIEDMYGGKISVVFIPCDREYDYISSSAIRSIKTVDDKFCGNWLVNDYPF